MFEYSRRAIVASCGLVLSTGFTGCLGGGSETSPTETQRSTAGRSPTPVPTTATQSATDTESPGLEFETPVEGNCTRSDPPRLTSTPEGLTGKSYPEFPTTLSEPASVDFAVSYERAYQYNRYLTEYSYADIERVSVQNIHDATATEYRDGFLVPVDGELDVSRDGVSEDLRFGAWYYVTDGFALRHATDGNITEDRPDTLSPSRVVGCE